MVIRNQAKALTTSDFISNASKKRSPTTIKLLYNNKCKLKWLFASTPIAITIFSVYFPYKYMPSILITSQQCLKLSIDARKAQKTQLNRFVYGSYKGLKYHFTIVPLLYV